MRKVGIILLAGFCLKLMISCCGSDADTVSTISSMTTSHLKVTEEYTVPVNDGKVSKDAYGIRINFSFGELALKKDFNSIGFSSSYAYLVNCQQFGYIVDTIADIRIVTLNDFNTETPENSDVSSCFGVSGYTGYMSLKDYARNLKNGNIETRGRIDLHLIEAPEFIGEYRFKVDILLLDGRTLTATTTTINLE